ncbi:glycoside hydrolase family 2 protein [Opitutales bacterium ASA1]|uniref:glycoside hydrolase family 2 protein n=1 Tax=Congregicoccus parvus TaxID=3081749 RepID=UPI002B2AE874|nr:glycoside hydrolase family 2 protein [Opitutales bacterium ASA1]
MRLRSPLASVLALLALGLAPLSARASTSTTVGEDLDEGLPFRPQVRAPALPAAASTDPRPTAAPITDIRDFPTALAHIGGRERLDLSGRWNYLVDPMRAGFRGSGWRRSLWRDAPAPESELVEYDWDTAPALHVPGDWNSQVEELKWYGGTVWLRRTFHFEPAADRTHLLYFEGVNLHAVVFLNGTRIGEHHGGFTPFALDATPHLRGGSNSIIVAVDATHGRETIPALNVDWWNYGGITRPVHLVTVPTTHIHDTRVRLQDADTIAATVRIVGPENSGQTVTIAIPELQWSAHASTDASGVAEISAPVPTGLARWTPDSPRLYTVETTSSSDAITERIGFRTIRVDGTRVLLDERPVFLRGISIHEEPFSAIGTRALSPAEARALLEEARALGANFVRLAHYPHSELVTRLADELGLLVWSEIPVYWDVDYGSPLALERARLMLAEMIRRDVNRCSIVFWSVANETPTREDRTRFLRRLLDDARTLDDTRLLTAALHATFDASVGTNTVLIDDPLGAYVDVIAFNRYEGWYGPRTPDQIDEVQWRSAFGKPLVFSEFGADALYGLHGPRHERYTEAYQAWVYERTLAMTERMPHLVGVSPWILKDFRSPRRYHGVFQNYWNRKGLVDPTGQRKAAFHVLRDWYAARAAEEASSHE